MMRPTDRHVQNRIQNVLIVCLVLSALFLLSRTELIGPDTFNRLFTSSVYSTENTNASQTSAQLPVRIAVRTGGVCQAWTGETTGGNVFEDLGPLLTEALGSASDGTTVDEKEFQRALENNSIWSAALMHGVWNLVMVGGLLHIGTVADSDVWVQYLLDSDSLLLTGGDFGIEASIVSIVVYLAFACLSLSRCRRKGLLEVRGCKVFERKEKRN